MLMHRIVHEVRRPEREYQAIIRDGEKAYRKKQREKIRQDLEKKKALFEK
jgi:DNA-binding ferritin-like protein (Dps family)